jgi:hypothetical protein
MHGEVSVSPVHFAISWPASGPDETVLGIDRDGSLLQLVDVHISSHTERIFRDTVSEFAFRSSLYYPELVPMGCLKVILFVAMFPV